jgi:hypothetical protein
MARINFNKVYEDRIEQIDKDIKSAVLGKKWTELAKLEAEKAKLESYISKEE